MKTRPAIDLTALEAALSWTSDLGSFETSACVSRETGEVFHSPVDGEGEEDWPADADDSTRYCQVPTKHDLDLGRRLVFRFVDEMLREQRDEVEGYFRHRGASRRWKDFLAAHGKLDAWYDYEEAATREALREWADAEGFVVVDDDGGKGAV